jgi:hypothetical protein
VNFDGVVTHLNRLLSRYSPETFNSSRMRRRAPACYRFIRNNIRDEVGGIDWDRVTYALERRKCRQKPTYRSMREINLVLNKYRAKCGDSPLRNQTVSVR